MMQLQAACNAREQCWGKPPDSQIAAVKSYSSRAFQFVCEEWLPSAEHAPLHHCKRRAAEQSSLVGFDLGVQHVPMLQLGVAAGMVQRSPGNYLRVQHKCDHQLSGGAAVALAFLGPRRLAFQAQRDLNRQHCEVLGAAAGAGAAQGL